MENRTEEEEPKTRGEGAEQATDVETAGEDGPRQTMQTELVLEVSLHDESNKI